jgi:hypothetical protein
VNRESTARRPCRRSAGRLRRQARPLRPPAPEPGTAGTHPTGRGTGVGAPVRPLGRRGFRPVARQRLSSVLRPSDACPFPARRLRALVPVRQPGSGVRPRGDGARGPASGLDHRLIGDVRQPRPRRPRRARARSGLAAAPRVPCGRSPSSPRSRTVVTTRPAIKLRQLRTWESTVATRYRPSTGKGTTKITRRRPAELRGPVPAHRAVKVSRSTISPSSISPVGSNPNFR